MGWRNLWRNGRRTWLTAGGVAFAVFLVVAFMCVQLGSYATMEQTATSLLTGEIQVQHRRYLDDPRLEHAIDDADHLAARVAAEPGVAAVAARAEAYALASVGERSFGAQVIGIDPGAEAGVVTLAKQIFEGRLLSATQEGVLGAALAKNLGVGVGDEVVVLGSGLEGGVAALALTVVGLFRSGIAELDRALLLAPIADVRQAFDLEAGAHRLVIRAERGASVDAVAAALQRALPPTWPAVPEAVADAEPLAVRTWQDLLPELHQAIEVDRISGALFYWLIMILVTFSVVNTFVMTVYERTREFGVLMAMGLRPYRLMAMLQWEAALLWGLGSAVGVAAAALLIAWLSRVGIFLGADMERLATEMYLPTRLYPTFTVQALLTAPLVMLVGTQLAAALPAWRLRRLNVVDAMRAAA
ncbi:MAG: FtsX-like permease family protein [Pseudomonadales bacterium]